MLLSRIGGGMLIAATALLAVIGSIAAGRGAVGIGVAGIGGMAVIAAIACLALGAGALAVATPADLRGRTIRIGLAILALGLAIAVPSTAARMDEPSIYALLIGGALAWLGAITTLVGLLIRRGAARRHGTAVLVGLGLAVLGGALASPTSAAGVLGVAGLVVALCGGIVLLATLVSFGLIALRAAPATRQAEAARP